MTTPCGAYVSRGGRGGWGGHGSWSRMKGRGSHTGGMSRIRWALDPRSPEAGGSPAMPGGFTAALNGSSAPSHLILFSHLYDIVIAKLVTFAPSSVCPQVSHLNRVMSDES